MRADLIEQLKAAELGALGRRVRSARIRAQLTQTQVAGSDLSTAYVSRIESGQRRPDAALLEAMAARIGVDVEELVVGARPDRLVDVRVRLDLGQLSLAGGEAANALTAIDEVIEDLAGMPSDSGVPELRRQALQARALALEASGDVEGAIAALEDFIQAGPFDLRSLEATTALSRCYRESGDLNAAVQVGDRSRQFIADHGLGGSAEAVALTLTIAAAHFERGDVAVAARMCRRALESAEKSGSSQARAAAYWNASIIESKAGRACSAVTLASKALRAFEESDDSRNLSRLRTQYGILQLRTDPPEPEEALVTLRRAETELTWTSAGHADLADNILAQARAHFLLGSHDRAEELLGRVMVVSGATTPVVAADAHVLRGQVYAADGRIDDARESYRAAVVLLSGVGADRAAAQIWFELGGLLEGVGDAASALDAYRRAATSTGLVSPQSVVSARP